MAAPRIQAEREIPESDRLEGYPHPRETRVLHGLKEAEAALLDAYRSGRIHHAWIIHGPAGIGKATLAYRFATFVLNHPDATAAPVRDAKGLNVDEDTQATHLVRAGSHPDLMTLRRLWDTGNKRFRTVLTVEEARRLLDFFSLTAAFGGWRVAIVDTVDDMNASAANALLKTLEEPPARSLILLVSHAPDRLLATIRSRCRKLAVDPPGRAELTAAIRGAGVGEALDALDPARRERLLDLARGSVRAGIELLTSGGLDLLQEVEAILGRWPRIDFSAVHALAGKVARRGADQEFELALQAVGDWLERRLDAAGTGAGEAPAAGPASLARHAEVWEKIARLKTEAGIFHFDRRQVILKAFRSVAELAP